MNRATSGTTALQSRRQDVVDVHGNCNFALCIVLHLVWYLSAVRYVKIILH